MIRDITIGQYYPVNSLLHKLDPRVKLFATVIYVIALFCFKGIAGLALITGFLYMVIKVSKVPFKFMTKGLKAIVVLVIITSVFNLFATPGDIVFWKWNSIQIHQTNSHKHCLNNPCICNLNTIPLPKNNVSWCGKQVKHGCDNN